MPVYSYKCLKCGGGYELDSPIKKRDEPKQCPTCHSKRSKRVLHAPTVHYATGGFYAKDNKRGNGRQK